MTKIFCQRRLFVRQNFVLCTHQILKIANFNFTEFSLSHFAEQLRRKNADILDIYFTLLDAAGIPSTLILDQNAKAKERGSWVPFKIWPSEAPDALLT